MADTFRASFLKIERAHRHLQELEEVVGRYLASNPAQFTPAPQIPGVINFGGMNLRGMPETTGAILGDIIHNLRASLDLMTAELCRLNGQSDEGVYFPFCETADELPEMIKRRHFDRAGREAVKLLTELKPYKGGNVALRAIHDLDIQDKHQSLIPSTMSVGSPVFRVDVIGGRPIAVPVGDQTKPSEIKLCMPAGGVFADQELIPCLHNLVEATTRVIEAFKMLRSPSG